MRRQAAHIRKIDEEEKQKKEEGDKESDVARPLVDFLPRMSCAAAMQKFVRRTVASPQTADQFLTGINDHVDKVMRAQSQLVKEKDLGRDELTAIAWFTADVYGTYERTAQLCCGQSSGVVMEEETKVEGRGEEEDRCECEREEQLIKTLLDTLHLALEKCRVEKQRTLFVSVDVASCGDANELATASPGCRFLLPEIVACSESKEELEGGVQKNTTVLNIDATEYADVSALAFASKEEASCSCPSLFLLCNTPLEFVSSSGSVAVAHSFKQRPMPAEWRICASVSELLQEMTTVRKYIKARRKPGRPVLHCTSYTNAAMALIQTTRPSMLPQGENNNNSSTRSMIYAVTARCVSDSRPIVLPDGTKATNRQLYALAAKLDPSNYLAVNGVAATLKSRKDVAPHPDPAEGGRGATQVELYVLALRHAKAQGKDFAFPYNNLGLAMCDKAEKVKLPDGTELNQQELYLRSIEKWPEYSDPYNNLANSLKGKETLRMPDGSEANAADLYKLAMKHEPANAKAYNNLGLALESKDETTTLPDGRVVNQRQLYLLSIEHEEDYTDPYNNLANTLTKDETVTLPDGSVLNKPELYAAALRHDPCNSRALYNLALCLGPTEKVRIPAAFASSGDGVGSAGSMLVGQRDLYLLTLKEDPEYSSAYINLGVGLAEGETVTLPDGTMAGARECYIQAIKHDPANSRAYANLGTTITKGSTVTLPDGTEADEKGLYVLAIKHDPTNSFAYNNLGLVLPTSTEQVALPDGTLAKKKDLYLLAVQHEPEHVSALINLGCELSATDTVTLPDGSSAGPRELSALAIKISPDNWLAFNNLGHAVSDKTEIVELHNGSRLRQKDLFLLAIAMGPDPSVAFPNLATSMSPFEEITLHDGRRLSREQLLRYK